MFILDKIVEVKRKQIEKEKLEISIDEMIEKYGQVPPEPAGSSNETLEYAKTAGFGPEAHDEGGLDENDPNFNTRTVI